jgi:hypothetical protein
MLSIGQTQRSAMRLNESGRGFVGGHCIMLVGVHHHSCVSKAEILSLKYACGVMERRVVPQVM